MRDSGQPHHGPNKLDNVNWIFGEWIQLRPHPVSVENDRRARTADATLNWNEDLVSSRPYVQNQDGMIIADTRSSTTHHLSLHSSVLFTQNSNIIILGWTPVLMSKARMIRLSPTPEVRLRTTLSLPRSDCILRVQDNEIRWTQIQTISFRPIYSYKMK